MCHMHMGIHSHTVRTLYRTNPKETLQCADDTVSSELKKEIQSARLAKKLTQAQLANLINEKPQVIQEYESGKVRC